LERVEWDGEESGAWLGRVLGGREVVREVEGLRVDIMKLQEKVLMRILDQCVGSTKSEIILPEPALRRHYHPPRNVGASRFYAPSRVVSSTTTTLLDYSSRTSAKSVPEMKSEDKNTSRNVEKTRKSQLSMKLPLLHSSPPPQQ